MVAMLFRRENAPLTSVVLTIFAAVFCGNGPNLTKAQAWNIKWLLQICFTRWTAEAWYTEELSIFNDVFEIQASTSVYGYTLGRFWFDIAMAVVIGTIFRIIAYALMIGLHRQKQR